MLQVTDLNIRFATRRGYSHVLDHVSFAIEGGESIGIVGESGSGKSVTSLAITKLLPSNAEIMSGSIQLPAHYKVSMIFQDPMSSLNPCFTVEYQLKEVLKIHQKLSGDLLHAKAIEYLKLVGISQPEERLKSYPFQLSGGQSQRIMIALAMAVEPDLLIADEPTTALDVTIQAQILQLLKDLQKQKKMSMLLISHDIGVIAQNTSKIYVMYAGQIVESGPTLQVIKSPQHPYTQALLGCLPANHLRKSENFRLPTIQGTVPDLHLRPKGCAFRERCLFAKPECEQKILWKSTGQQGYRCIK